MALSESISIREELDHPVIDADGHFIELIPVFEAYVRDRGYGDLLEHFQSGYVRARAWDTFTAEERAHGRLVAPAYWVPGGDTKYLATVALPSLYHARLAEAGIDFAVLYPTSLLHLFRIADDKARVVLCRLYNEFQRDQFAPYSDRMTPAALVPMNTPGEAIEGLDHAAQLGLKVVAIPTYVWRRVPADSTGRSQWLDTYGIDSIYDYDGVWKRAIDLRYALNCHSAGMRFSDRSSISNYMYNHIGHFAAAGEATAKSLFFGGVTQRFPQLHVAFLEGGVAHAVRIYLDIIARWEKRGPMVIERLNPRTKYDISEFAQLLGEAGGDLLSRFSPEELIESFSEPGRTNDFTLSKVSSAEEIRDRFCSNFYWGCEADDPLVGMAFDGGLRPFGGVVRAMMGSDLGHWDAPDFTAPLAEAYELIEKGILSSEEFQEYVFSNAAHCYGDLNPNFFVGTAVEAAAGAMMAGGSVEETLATG